MSGLSRTALRVAVRVGSAAAAETTLPRLVRHPRLTLRRPPCCRGLRTRRPLYSRGESAEGARWVASTRRKKRRRKSAQSQNVHTEPSYISISTSINIITSAQRNHAPNIRFLVYHRLFNNPLPSHQMSEELGREPKMPAPPVKRPKRTCGGKPEKFIAAAEG